MGARYSSPQRKSVEAHCNAVGGHGGSLYKGFGTDLPYGFDELRLALSVHSLDSHQHNGGACGQRQREMRMKIVIERDTHHLTFSSEIKNVGVISALETGFADVECVPPLGPKQCCCPRSKALVQQDPPHATLFRSTCSSSTEAAA